jgi:predicted Zn-dependent peptidase
MDAARQYLIGVFPLRFETPSQVVSAIGGLVVHDLPDDELDRYRAAIAAVTAEDVLAAASHVDPDQASVVLVGDAARFERELRAAGLGPLSVLEASTS